ncbi:MAG: hypothetical protein JO328_00700 [Hyphomicrobiales bacterium]|nr:hypothetical protein [Hyphomicrobiales bacterium]MBV8826383.1 hypothetical protein [Hyphomicrobiales bacterium]MBV9428661.1 hypothetical protein [Bradyrhizobiaceae bacterium]
MEKNIPVREVRKFLSPRKNIDVMRVYYCYQIGSTFTNLGLMESQIITAMTTCDRIKVTKALQDDVPFWDQIVQRHSHLDSSTLGNLVTILSKHKIAAADLAYLRWVTAKRNFFIHRFFGHYAWPGDLSEAAIRVLCRRLRYLEYVFARAGNRIHKIFSRAGLVEYMDLGEDGALIANVGSLEGEDAWLKELVVAEVRRHARSRR